MKRIAVCLLALLLCSVAWADLVVSAGNGNELRLFQSPCVHGGTLGHIGEEWRARFRKAQADVGGHMIYACWIDTGEGVYFVMFESGVGVAYPITAFIEQPGV